MVRAAIGLVLGLAFELSVWAEPHLVGRVRLEPREPAVGVQVLLFDLADLRAAPVAATTDRSGQFTLPLATLAGAVPEQFELGANYPNPFNPSTMIPYQLPTAMYVRLEVFNILGQRVAILVDREQPAGFHTASWDATDAAGEAVGAGVYLYRLSGDGMQATRSMLLIDGQAGIASGRVGPTGSGGEAGAGENGEGAPVYGLTVSGSGLVPYIDPAFRLEAGMPPLDLVVEAPGSVPSAKAASSNGILGDVDNTGSVDFFDALLVALYSRNSSIVMPNSGDISLGDVNADGQVGLADAWLIAAYLNDSSDPSLPAGIGEPVGPAASLSPDPSTVTFADDGAWHRFTVEAGEPVTVVANPAGTPPPPRLEITTRSSGSNFCPAEADDDVSREDGQVVYLAGCATGTATVELRRPSDGTVLNTYTFEVTGSPPDLAVQSVSVSDNTLTPGQSFTLRATVRNQGTGQSAATTLRYYRSSNRTISTRDTQVGADPVGALAASGTSAESISLTAPSSEGTYYYGACVVSVSGESDTRNNCSGGIRVTVEARTPDLVVVSASVSNSTLTTGQSFTLSATVRNGGSGRSGVTTLHYYRSTDATISTRDTQVGTDPVGALGASRTSAESIRLTAPSSAGTYYYGACVAGVSGESDTRNNCSPAVQVIVNRTTASKTSKLYWTSGVARKIQRSNLDGSGVENLVSTGLEGPSGIALDVAGGKMYWVDAITDKIQRSNLDGSGVENLVSTGLEYPRRIALDVAGGKMYWTDYTTKKIQRSNLDGSGVENLVSTGLEGPIGIALDVAGGKMYWTDGVTDKIQRSNLDGSGVEDLVTGVVWPGGFALDVAGGKMYWVDAITDKIQRSNLDGSGVEDLVTTGLVDPWGIALDVAGGKMYWTDYTAKKIQRSNLDGSGVEDLISTGLEGPSGIALGLVPVEAGPDLPDLVVRTSVDDNTLTTGQSFTLRATVRNQGNASAAATTLRYYRSSNATISTDDTEMGTDGVGTLSAGATSDESISLNAPSAAGTYYYGACVDNVSSESNADNNCSSGVSVTVNGGAGGTSNLGACRVGLVVRPDQSCTVSGGSFRNVGDGCFVFTPFGPGRSCTGSFYLNGLQGTRVGNDFQITAVP